ncbi:hypothetical protein ACFL1U_00995 [Patescibacteria group bacterium]
MRNRVYYGFLILFVCVLFSGCSFHNLKARGSANTTDTVRQRTEFSRETPVEKQEIVDSIVIDDDGWIWYGGYEYFDQVKAFVLPGVRKPVKTISCELIEKQDDWYIMRFKLPKDRQYCCFNFYNSKTGNWQGLNPEGETNKTLGDIFMIKQWFNRGGKDMGSCYSVQSRFEKGRLADY